MNSRFNRRDFLREATAAVGMALGPSLPRLVGAPPASRTAFSFVLLGDLHFDRMEHHDFAWLSRKHPNDRRQIENYSRITKDITPRLLATVRETVAELNRTPATRVAFVLQAGDLVEGLCGSNELAVRHNSEALALVREAQLGAPFLFTKGNHDVTGDGAKEAFASVFHPYLTAQAAAVSPGTGELKQAHYGVDVAPAQFAFFDAYQTAESLEWFEAYAARRSAEHLFVVVHPPVVPYGARATWHVFASEKDRARREKFLGLLGRHRAIVLGGHIHKFNTLAREAGGGRFAQLALSSVIDAPEVKVKDLLEGVAAYDGDQIRVEPKFSPETEAARRAVYAAERPFVRAFDYADLPGYVVVTVDGPRVVARMYAGISRQLWRSVDLSALAGKA
jgi:3',5'-cyclic AMP phosphodiesterase CpdA